MDEIKKLVAENYRLGKGVGAGELVLRIKEKLLTSIDIELYMTLTPYIEKCLEDYKNELVIDGIYE